MPIFSKAERIDYARRLERIESFRVKECQVTSTGGINPSLRNKGAEAEYKGTDDSVAE